MKKLLLFIAIGFATIATNAQAPTNGLLAYYGFEGNGNSQNGLSNLTNLHSNGTPITYSPGGNSTGLAAFFNNTGLKTTAFDSKITNEFTICFWQWNQAVQLERYATRFELFGSAFYRNDTFPGNQCEAKVSTTNSIWAGPAMTVQQPNGAWQHIAVTYKNSGRLLVYVNGVNDITLIENIGFANLIKYNQIFSIGAGADANGNIQSSKSYIGYIDEVYVYNRGLGDAEILRIKNDLDGVPTTLPIVSAVSSTTTNNTASVSYTLNANGSDVTSIIKYGTTAGVYPNQVSGLSATVSTPTSSSVLINNLAQNTAYYYQIEATNAGGTTTSTGTFTTTNTSNTLTDGLLAFYNFEGNNNSYDNLHNLNATNLTTGGIASFSAGKYGQGSFYSESDPNDPNIAFGGELSNTSMNSVFNTTEYSIAFWEYRPLPYHNGPIPTVDVFGGQILTGANGAGTGKYNIYYLNGNTSSLNYQVINPNTISNTWTHYAVVWGTTAGQKYLKTYVNGSLVATSPAYPNSSTITKSSTRFTFCWYSIYRKVR